MEEAPLVVSREDLQQRMYTHELHRWLKSTGRKDVLEKYETAEMGRKNYDLLISGLESEENSEEKLATIVRFAKPGAVANNLLSGEALEDTLSETAGGAITKVLHGSSNIARNKAGIHPVTLLTEQKRKVILHALMNKEHVRPEHRVKQQVPKNMLQAAWPSGDEADSSMQKSSSIVLTQAHISCHSDGAGTRKISAIGRMQSSSSIVHDNKSLSSQDTYTTIGSDRRNNLDRLLQLKGKLQSPSQHSRSMQSQTRSKGFSQQHQQHQSSASNNSSVPPMNLKDRHFQPKWEHYDTMRARWSYLHPQVRHLLPQDGHLAPDTNQRYLHVDGVVLNGKLNDIQYYESVHDRMQHKSQRVMNHTGQLLAEKIEREGRYYKPNPCVYY